MDAAYPAMKSVLLLGERSDPQLVQLLAEGFWHAHALRPADVPQRRRASDGLPQVGLICLRQAQSGGFEPLASAARALGDIDWIGIVTPESAADERVREFIARHCISYQTAPLGKERLLYALGHAAGMRQLLSSTRGEVRIAEGHSLIVGDSLPMQRLRRDLLKIAAVDVPVLLTGESGSGKELAAQTIHEQSRRGSHDFVAINCAALSPTLIHAELFGAERGAFTGAHQRRTGQLEAAHLGTVFLDEIGDLHPDLQVLLLRFLEEKSVRRVGGREPVRVDARVVAATNVDLEGAVRRGRFREDLYHRLNVLRVRIPPLRERREDIEPLARMFLARFAGEHGRRIEGFARSTLVALNAYHWPGNVRELLNCIRRAVVLGEGRLLTAADLQIGALQAADVPPALEQARHHAEREALERGLACTGGSVDLAARLLRVSRATLYRLVDKHGLGRVATPGADGVHSQE